MAIVNEQTAPQTESLGEVIRIQGARMHNLKNLTLEIPRDQFVVITGPSGSGKSSLAFDTLFAEGQRQYLESLSTYSRQFLHQLERPDVDLIEGLQPTVAIDQRVGSANPRSTVATVTEIYDYLRILMARVGTPLCPNCKLAIQPRSAEEIIAELRALPEATKLVLLAPMVRGRKGQHREVFEEIRKAGFIRARVNGEMVDIDHVPELAVRKNHEIEAVVDRLILRTGVDDRLAESVHLALQHGQGSLIASILQDGAPPADPASWENRLFSTLYACPGCKTSFAEIEPRTFSFNSPYGACPSCDGLGTRLQFDREVVLPELSQSISSGAVAPWREVTAAEMAKHLKALAPFFEQSGLTADTPLAEFTDEQQQWFWLGHSQPKLSKWIGLQLLLEKQLATATKAAVRQKLESFQGQVVCHDCGGTRLRIEGRSVLLADRSISEITHQSATEALTFFEQLQVPAAQQPVAEPLVSEISKRLQFLQKVGLTYLTLDRAADTLSGGELQRVRLASNIGSGLVGVCYVLDEPSIGLHSRDNERLILALRQLQAQGNTVLVVEHDDAMMLAADYLFDLGPGAGIHGGEIVAQGTPQQVCADPSSLTGAYLSGQQQIPVPQERRPVSAERAIAIEGAVANNLKSVSTWLPLSALVCITGVSGSGKSTLLNETLAPAIAQQLGLKREVPSGSFTQITGIEQIDKLIEVDQSPIGRNPRSNPATYTGMFDEIRKIFAGTREARQLGYKAGRFSFNVKGGRCEDCQGQGLQKIEMNFLPDIHVLCPVCRGQRFNQQTLMVRYKDHTIADVLNLNIDQAAEFFANFTPLNRMLTSLQSVGLGYLTLGQSATTLSGGEAQRIKLATELARVNTGRTLYLLDEPTTGLHFEDIRKLLEVLNRLVELGNTVWVIEHNLEVIKSADWIIDLGPEGGAAGGQIVATGTPETVAQNPASETGRFLRPLLLSRC